MRIVCIGAGAAGLYLSLLLKKADPRHEVTVFERNSEQDTFGFGVVFSDATLDNFARADPETHRAIANSFFHWDDIETHYRQDVVRSTGHGFAGLSRRRLLEILSHRAEELGVEIRYQQEISSTAALEGADLIVGADGVNSLVRSENAKAFEPELDWRKNRFVWLGTTFPFDAFTFYFKETDFGLFRVHAYRFEPQTSTFIVECTEDTLLRAGLVGATEDQTVSVLEGVFRTELAGHPLLKNRSIWRQFPTVKNRRWWSDRLVLVGDAAHTAHFSVGSGTKLAMDGAIALAKALLLEPVLSSALARYEAERRPEVESLQRAAQVSLEWFENTERYRELDPLQFTFSLLTRSLRVSHQNLERRDPKLIERVDRNFAERAAKAAESRPMPARGRARPPMFTPFRLRGLVLENRVVVSPMCQYSAEDGTINDWHLVHLGSRALGGAGLVITEMTDVTKDGRITPLCAGMYQADHLGAWKRVVDFVHRYSPAKIGIQLAHAGRKGATRPPWKGQDQPLAEGGWPLLAPSALPYLPHSPCPKAMGRADREAVLADFVRAATMSDQAGFDLLEIHCAHGYLLGSFISPLTNQRTDEYGGSIEGRARYPLEVFDAIREIWPDHKPISVRISATDWAPGGLSTEDLLTFARLLKGHGADIIDVSAGQTIPDQQPVYGRLFQTPFSEHIRLEVGVPTMTVGAISTYADVNGILAAGRADLCVLARAHLFDPYWTLHAAAAQDVPVSWPQPYQAVAGYKPKA